jgi:uncharacterized membrane protein YkvI
MPILIILLIAVLVAQFGFWDAFASVLGAIGVLVLLFITGVALLALVIAYAMRRRRGV